MIPLNHLQHVCTPWLVSGKVWGHLLRQVVQALLVLLLTYRAPLQELLQHVFLPLVKEMVLLGVAEGVQGGVFNLCGYLYSLHGNLVFATSSLSTSCKS